MRVRGGAQQDGVRVDMTPMVDIMMLLIIFFIMSTTFVVVNSGFTINLPNAVAEQQRRDQVAVLVNREGMVSFDGKIVSKVEIPAVFQRAGINGATVVSVKADKAVSHGQVVEVMDAIRKAGVVKISIAVETKGS